MKNSRMAVAAIGVSVASVAIALSTPAIALPGKNTVDSGDIKNNSVTGKDINESTLASVPSADSATTADSATSADTANTANTADTADALSPLPSGESQSGVFSAGGAGAGAGGWLGVPIVYPRPLTTDIANNHIVDAVKNPTANCPGPGQAAPGYLCLYNSVTSGAGAGYGYSDNAFLPSPSVGAVVYFPITGANSYVGGSWTVTAP